MPLFLPSLYPVTMKDVCFFTSLKVLFSNGHAGSYNVLCNTPTLFNRHGIPVDNQQRVGRAAVVSQQPGHDRMQSSVGRPVGHLVQTAEEQRKSDRAPGAQTRAQNGLAEPHSATNVRVRTTNAVLTVFFASATNLGKRTFMERERNLSKLIYPGAHLILQHKR